MEIKNLKALKVLQRRNDMEEIQTFSKNKKKIVEIYFKSYYKSAMFANYLIKYQLIFPVNLLTKTMIQFNSKSISNMKFIY